MTTLMKPSLLPNAFSDFFADDDFWATNYFTNKWANKLPAANVIEKDDAFMIELAVPGMTKKDFHIDVENSVLKVSCEKEEEHLEEKENFTRKEFSYNSFSRTFGLPDYVDADKINATYKDGVLMLSIPKKEESKKSKRKEIAVK